MTDSVSIQDVRLIEEREFSALVTRVYGRPYRLQQNMMLGQDTIYPLTVPEPEPVDESHEPSFAEWASQDPDLDADGHPWRHAWEKEIWWEREFYPPFSALVNDLYERGHLPMGTFMLHVWW